MPDQRDTPSARTGLWNGKLRFHRNDRPTQGDGNLVFVSFGIEDYAIPVSNLLQMKVRAICLYIGGVHRC